MTRLRVTKIGWVRNVALTPPYFHSGRVSSLEQAVALMGTAQLGRRLSQGKDGAIAAFLAKLTGRHPSVEYPVLPPHTAETPRPDVRVVSQAGG